MHIYIEKYNCVSISSNDPALYTHIAISNKLNSDLVKYLSRETFQSYGGIITGKTNYLEKTIDSNGIKRVVAEENIGSFISSKLNKLDKTGRPDATKEFGNFLTFLGSLKYSPRKFSMTILTLLKGDDWIDQIEVSLNDLISNSLREELKEKEAEAAKILKQSAPKEEVIEAKKPEKKKSCSCC